MTVNAHTFPHADYQRTLPELVVESADSSDKSADSSSDFMIVSRRPVLNVFSILSASAKYCKQQLAKLPSGARV